MLQLFSVPVQFCKALRSLSPPRSRLRIVWPLCDIVRRRRHGVGWCGELERACKETTEVPTPQRESLPAEIRTEHLLRVTATLPSPVWSCAVLNCELIRHFVVLVAAFARVCSRHGCLHFCGCCFVLSLPCREVLVRQYGADMSEPSSCLAGQCDGRELYAIFQSEIMKGRDRLQGVYCSIILKSTVRK